MVVNGWFWIAGIILALNHPLCFNKVCSWFTCVSSDSFWFVTLWINSPPSCQVCETLNIETGICFFVYLHLLINEHGLDPLFIVLPVSTQSQFWSCTGRVKGRIRISHKLSVSSNVHYFASCLRENLKII